MLIYVSVTSDIYETTVRKYTYADIASDTLQGSAVGWVGEGIGAVVS